MPIEVTPNYIRVRVADPKLFKTFRVITLSEKKGIRAVIGIPKKGGSSVIQSIMFAKSKGWTISKVRKWIREHGYTIQEIYLVYGIDIDPKRKELVLHETVYKEKFDVKNLSGEKLKWLIE